MLNFNIKFPHKSVMSRNAHNTYCAGGVGVLDGAVDRRGVEEKENKLPDRRRTRVCPR